MSYLPFMDANGLRWTIAPCVDDPTRLATLVGANGLSLDGLIASEQARIVKHAPHRTVYRVVLPGLDVHVKHYRGDSHEWLRAFFRPSKARSEFGITREVARRGVPTLEALAFAESNGESMAPPESFLITRTLNGAVPLVDYLEQTLPSLSRRRRVEVRQRLSESIGHLLARKHGAGLRHDDLHPGNILVRAGEKDRLELYLIDLHAVRLGKPLVWRTSLDNLVILNRWFLIRCNRSDRRRAWHAYCEEREDLKLDERPLARKVEIATRESFVEFARALDHRCLGGNRHFRRIKTREASGYVVADVEDIALIELLASPDEPFDRSTARVLKKSASSAVVELDLTVAGRPRRVIFKRFSVTAWSDPLAAMFRPTAGLRSWIIGHGLRFRGLPTPRPLALWHRRRLGMPAEAYLLMEKVPDAMDLSRFIRSLDGRPAGERMGRLRALIREVASVVRMMHERNLSHRDLKAPNLLVSPADWTLGYRGLLDLAAPMAPGRDRVWLVDLVGVRRHDKLERARKVQNLARLNVSFVATGGLTRSDRLRFLRDYLGWGLFGREGWKQWWKEVEIATREKVERNRKMGRVLG
jgi:tRNA A-37 threonylcarbamoyl transferase component Bud32